MKLDDFDFELPEELIALRPAKPRPASRLLVAEGDGIEDSQVARLGDHLRPGDLLILNDTKVLPARITGLRTRPGATGSRIDCTLISLIDAGRWRVLARPGKRLATGDNIAFDDDLSAQVIEKDGAEVILEFNQPQEELAAILDRIGRMPLPPYIAAKRDVDDQDREDYQTVFAKNSGAVAAPTASLHFDDALLNAMAGKGVGMAKVTLHVGAGTFLPVKVEDISKHRMHAEWGNISVETAQRITETKARGGRIIPVGTTALRVIETAATGFGTVAPWTGLTDIFIRPGYEFRITDGLMTNFHLPKSTLLMLVSALMGRETMLRVYDHAIREKYRFFSYGDSSLLIPK
ncbi:tRNA preQ1(34) S-adenosylmethionine ribosyltransferase-isomerase QueA [Amaricoccus tamworthensis]|uniref:tRNA preQ1(34) S-adenosylmethionine ribosyltransferase-isomerase QueA n=1 Tax=Amaricoccus tamworthensis TaxID=57002 RepID=UPI003C7D063E